MSRIVRLVVLVVLAFVAYDYGWPWLQGVLADQGGESRSLEGGMSDDGGEVENCLELATAANDEFASRVGQFIGRQGDTGDWMQFAGGVQNRIGSAQSACGCIGEGCVLASRAMSELETLVQEVDGAVRGATEGAANAANRQEKVYDLLNQAAKAN